MRSTLDTSLGVGDEKQRGSATAFRSYGNGAKLNSMEIFPPKQDAGKEAA